MPARIGPRKVFNPIELLVEEVRDLKRKLKLYQNYMAVFESEAGQLVLHDLLTASGMFQPSQRENPHQTAYYEGRRSIGLHLLSRLRKDNVPAILQLLEEKANDNRRPDTITARPEDTSPVLD